MPHESTEQTIGQLLYEKGLMLTTAESCTGGLVASLITDVPGSSAYFLGGVVTYSNKLKRDLLGVAEATLEQYGAVSQETTLAMARGARERFDADIAVSVTGIAGPGGGTPEKPVGLTWIGFSAHDQEAAFRFMWNQGREQNKLLSAQAALKLIEEYLEQRGG